MNCNFTFKYPPSLPFSSSPLPPPRPPSSGLVSRLLSYTDYLRDWRPGSSELGLLTHHPGQALVQFAHSNDKAWATAYLREIGNVVDTLILLGYSRQSLGLEQLAHAVKRFVTQPLAVDTNRALQSLLYRAMRLEVEKVQAGILAVNFKFVVLFAECFQFWRAFGSNSELMLDHPVFEGQAPDAFTVVETLDSTTDLLSRSLEGAQAKAHREEHQRQFLALNTRVKAASGSALLQQPAIKVTLWLWNLFLSTFVPRAKLLPVTALDLGREEVLDGLVAMVRENLGDSDMVVDASGRRHTASATRRIRSCMLVASRDAHAHLVHAPLQFVPSTSSSNNGSGNGGSSGANRFHYCSVLQELTNILVHTVTLDEHDAGAINELGNVSTLVELTYGADPELCAVFWSSWRDWQAQLQEHQRQQQDWANRSTASMRPAEAPSASYPLCRLVQILVERTPHDPIYLLRMLAALACSPAACASIAQEILNQPAPLITYEPLESLVFRATLPSVHLGSNARNVEVVANDIESLEVAPSTAADFRGSSLRGWSTPIQWDRPYRWVREHGGTVAAGTAAMKVPAHDAARYAARVLSQQPSSGSHMRHQHQHHQLIPFGAAEGLGVGGTSSTRPHLRGSSLYEPEALAYGTVLSTDFSGDAQELLDGAGLGLSSMGLSEAEPRSLGRALVQWHGQQYVWWAVLVEMLMQLTAATSASLEQDPDLGAQVPAVIALLNRLLSGCPQNIVFISTKWNEVALYTLLRELNLLQYFSVLSEHDVHIDALRGSPCPSSNWHSSASASFDLLTAIGVPRLVAEEMVVRARSPSTQESALYELSLCDVITKAAANVLVLSIHAANAAVGQAAAATAGGTGGSRAARGTAINIGQARALFLASSGLFATLFSVSRQWAFSAATYSHTVLGLHEHALLSDTGHRDSLLEQLHTVAMRWPHLTEPVFAHVNDLSAAWFTLFPLWSISNAPVLQLFRLLLQVQDQDQPRSADSSSIAAAASSAAGSASLRIDTLARVLVVDFEVDISSKELVDVCSALGLLHPLQPADQSSSSCGNSSGRLGGNRNSLGNSSKDMDHYRLDVLQFLKLVTGADVAHQPVPVSSAKDPSTHAHRAPIDSALARIRSQLRSVLRRSEFTDGLAAPGQQSSAATAAGGVPSRRLGVREVDLMRTTVVFLLNEYTHLVRAPDALPVGPEGTCSLLLDCLSSMQAAFTHCSNAATAAAVAESPAYHLMLNAASSAQFLESLVQLSLLPAVIAICTGGGAPADTTSSSSSFSSLIIRVDSSRPRTFRELLQRGGDTSRSGAPDHQQSGDRAQTVCGGGGGGGGGGIGSGNMGCLPLLFSAFRSGQPLVSHALVELVLRVAHLASSLLAHMLEYAAVLSNGQVGAGEAEEQRAVDAELRGCGAAVTSALMTAYTTHCSPGTALPWLMTLFISSSKTGSSSSDGAQSSLLQSSSGIGTSSMHASDLPAQRRYVTLLAGMLDELRVSTRSTTASADSVSEGSLITSCRELVVAHRTVSARLLLQVVQALPVGPSFSSLSEYIGTGNIVPLCGILCRLLSASASSGSGSGASSTTVAADGDALKVQVMQLLLILAQRHPATLCMLLSISDKAVAECDDGSSGPAAQCLGLTGTAPAALASSALLRALLQCLGSAELLFTRCPPLLHALYRFVTLLAQARDFGLMRRAALHLAQERGFWDHVTVPLMVDVPPPPPLEFSVAPLDLHSTFPVSAGAGEVAAEDGRDHTGTSTSPPASPAAVAADKLCAAFIRCKTSGEAWRSSSADCGTTVTRYAQQLRCHASALELLSIERYGIFYEIDTAAAAKITKKTQSFYVKATETHRFISWIKHYLSIRIDDSLVQSVVKQARVLGINLSELSVLRQGLRASSSSRAGSGVGLGAEREALGSSVELPLQTEECYGPDFQLSTSRLRALVESTFLCAMFSGSSSTSDYSTGADDGAVELDDVVRTTLYLQTRLLASVQALNCSCSLSRASLALVRAWRKFLEFYVLPGSALKQHVDSLAGAGEGGAAGAGASGGGSAVDVVRHPASGSPILVGALSPTSSGPSASPVSQKQSSFSGDRRSYEVVGEVVAHLERHRTDGLMLSALGRCAVAEKCELLVSMLHHQLKQVGSRASEPGQSEVRARDIGSMRLTQDKMELLLQKLDGCYHDMIFATAAGSADEAAEEQAAAQATRRRSSRNAACSATNSGRDGDSIDDEGETFASEIDAMFLTLAGESLSEASGGEASKTAPISSSSFTASVEVALAHSSALKSQVALRLLTAMALLLRAICTFNSSDEARSRLSARRRSVFRYAVVALRNLIEAYGAHRLFACLSMTSGSSSSNSGSDSYGRGDSSSWTPTRPRRNERGAEEAKAATPGGGSHNSSSGSGHSSSSSLQLVSGQAIAHLCLQILQLAIPPSSTRAPLVSVTDKSEWTLLLQSTQTVPLLTAIVRKLSTSTSSAAGGCSAAVLAECDFTAWNSETVIADVSRPCAEFTKLKRKIAWSDAASLSDGGGRGERGGGSQELQPLVEALTSCLDVAIAAMGANIFMIQHTEWVAELVKVLCDSPLLHAYQQALAAQPEDIAAILAGYSGINGQQSVLARLWLKTLAFVELVVVSLQESSNNLVGSGAVADSSNSSNGSSSGGDRSSAGIRRSVDPATGLDADTSGEAPISALKMRLGHQLCSFLRTYVPLLLLPLRPQPALRYSAQQLRFVRASFSLFTSCHTYFPSWRVELPAVAQEVQLRALATGRTFSLLLGSGDGAELPDQQRRLLGHLVAVSEAEKRMGRRDVRRRR